VLAKKTTPLPWPTYHMVLRMNDTSLQPGYGPSYVSSFLCGLVLSKKLVPVPKYHAVSWKWTLSFAFRPPFSRARWRLYKLKNKINVTRRWIGLCGEEALLYSRGYSARIQPLYPSCIWKFAQLRLNLNVEIDTCIRTVNNGNVF